MKFDVVFTDPTASTRGRGGRPPARTWVAVAENALTQWLKRNGVLYQVVPTAFSTPHHPLLQFLRTHTTTWVDFDVAGILGRGAFTSVAVINTANPTFKGTKVIKDGQQWLTILDDSIHWLPIDLCEEALNIHRKAMFVTRKKLDVHVDPSLKITKARIGKTISPEESAEFPYPVLHTTGTWYTNKQQDWATDRKVMWTRGGLPFFDRGELGGTDQTYYIPVATEKAGKILADNLNTLLMRYLFETAKWPGYNRHDAAFALPAVPTHKRLTNEQMFDLFNLTPKERAYVTRRMG